jgi:dihydrolipoamide dehydrogenase
MACVGLTPDEAKESGYDLLVGTAPLIMNALGMIISEMNGIVELVADKKYGEILGIHIIAKAASEMAGQAILAIQMEMTLEELCKVSFPHPTLSESLAEAARDALGRPIYLP